MAKKKEDTQSILAITTGFLLLSILFNKHPLPSKILLGVSIVPGIVHLISPKLGHYIVIAWEKLAEAMGWVSSRVILSLVYYLFLFPISIIYRLSNKNHLQRKKPSESVFIERNHQYSKKDLENIW